MERACLSRLIPTPGDRGPATEGVHGFLLFMTREQHRVVNMHQVDAEIEEAARPGQRRRDLEDVYFVVSQYAARAASDDIFSALGDDSLDHLSFEHLGTHLIGQRIAHCITARSRVRITEVLREIARGGDDGPLTSLVPPMTDAVMAVGCHCPRPDVHFSLPSPCGL